MDFVHTSRRPVNSTIHNQRLDEENQYELPDEANLGIQLCHYLLVHNF